MTAYGWDTSHYDDPPTSRDGLSFYTHKCTDGAHFYADAEYQSSMNAAKNLGIPVLGAYHVLWDSNVTAQIDWFYEKVNTLTPWWKTHLSPVDGELYPFIWQLDCEPFDYNGGKPSKTSIQNAVNYMQTKYNIELVCIEGYCPKWAYQDTLTGLTCRLWASSYVSGSGPYEDLYPGDNSIRWSSYSGQSPIFLQYTSSAVIAGQTTCDANAYRGTEQELIDYLRGGSVSTFSDVWKTDALKNPYGDSATNPVITAETYLYDIAKDLMAVKVKVATLSNTTIDYDALADAIVAKLPPTSLTKQDVVDALNATKLQVG